jgi:transposase
MITEAQRAAIRRLFYAEHWRIGTIAAELGLHPTTVRAALETASSGPRTPVRASRLDPYPAFIRATLEQYPKLRATRIHEMIVARGYDGSVQQTRRLVRRLRPRPRAEAYLRLRTLPGEQAQVDWGHFGQVQVGRATRPLSAFVMVLGWSRALHVLFTLDQTMESFLRGHVEAFAYFGGAARTLLYDNLRSSSSIPGSSSSPVTTTSCPGPVRWPVATRRAASNDRSASCAIASLQPGPSATRAT